MTKHGSDDFKKLDGCLTAALPSKKTQMQKTAHDFQLSFVAFQRAQQVSAEKLRTIAKSVKLVVGGGSLNVSRAMDHHATNCVPTL